MGKEKITGKSSFVTIFFGVLLALEKNQTRVGLAELTWAIACPCGRPTRPSAFDLKKGYIGAMRLLVPEDRRVVSTQSAERLIGPGEMITS